jgi:hypothetical protein
MFMSPQVRDGFVNVDTGVPESIDPRRRSVSEGDDERTRGLWPLEKRAARRVIIDLTDEKWKVSR